MSKLFPETCVFNYYDFLQILLSEKGKKIACSKRLKEDRISQLPDPLICHIFSHLSTKEAVKTSVLSKRWTSLWLWAPRLKGDMISRLPDPLICHILSYLPTEEAIKTSTLSTRWTSLWLSIPCLDLTVWKSNVNAFQSIGDRFFDSSRVSCIDKFKLTIRHYNPSYLTPWINAAVKRNIQHLDVWFLPNSLYEIPLRLRTCETLVSLNLSGLAMANAEFVSLPCLKTMQLKYIWFRKEAIFERLVSCCPVLEELKISRCVNDKAKVFQVVSRSLKKLRIKRDEYDSRAWSKSCRDQDFGSGFVIDAPQLCFLRIYDKLSDNYVINDMDSNAKADISLSFGLDVFDEASISSRRSSICSFLSGISKIREMTICRDTFKLMCQYSKIEPLPQFAYMSHLHVTFRVSDWKCLPTFLESCPNLKSLILVWNTNSKKMHSEELRRFNYSLVPECLLSSLEFVDIKTCISGHVAELDLVMVFLRKARILKKLAVRLNYYGTNEKYIVNTILEFPRCSTTCRVVIY